jgi:hypothetical protein
VDPIARLTALKKISALPAALGTGCASGKMFKNKLLSCFPGFAWQVQTGFRRFSALLDFLYPFCYYPPLTPALLGVFEEVWHGSEKAENSGIPGTHLR